MAFGIGGDVAARTGDRMDRQFMQQLALQQFQQQVEQQAAQQQHQQEQMQIQRDQQTQRTQEHADEMRFREQEQEQQEKARRDASNRAGVETQERQHALMGDETKRRTVEGIVQRMPTGAARTATELRSQGVQGINPEDLEDPAVLRQRKADDTRATAEAQYSTAAKYREPPRDTKPRVDIRNVPSRGPNGEPGTKVITLYDGIPVREQWEPGNPSAGERTGLAMNDAADQSLSDLESLFDPGYVGPVAGRAGQLGQKIPGVPVNEGAAQFYSASAAFRNAVIKAITGAQMSEAEAVRITQQIPMPENKPEVWAANVAQSRQNLQRMRDQQRARQGLPTSTTPDTGGSSEVQYVRDPRTGRLVRK